MMKTVKTILITVLLTGVFIMENSPKALSNGSSSLLLEQIMGLMKVPSNVKTVNLEDWSQFESQSNLIFPEDFKMFVAVYGCGSVEKIFFVTAPMCEIAPGITSHEENLVRWEADKDIDYSVPNFTKIPLYPDLDGVYIWGHSFDAVSYGWKTASEDGKVFAMPEETIAFDKFGEKKELGSFLEVVLSVISGKSNIPVTLPAVYSPRRFN